MIRRILPLAAAVLLVAAVALAIHLLRTGPEPGAGPESGPGGDRLPAADSPPDWLGPEQREAVQTAQAGIRAKLGADARAVEMLTEVVRALGEEPGRVADFLDLVRTEVRLASRSGDAKAGRAALAFLSAAHRRGDARARALLTGSAFRDLASEGLAHGIPEVRVEAVTLLRELGDLQSRTEVISALPDPDPRVRKAAIEAYAAMKPSPAPARFRALFESEPEISLRVELLRILGSDRALRGRETRELEQRVLKEGAEAEVLQAIANLAANQDHQDLEPFLALLSSDSTQLRRSALRTLLVLRDRRALDAVRACREAETSEELRKLADRVIQALGGS